MGLSLLSSLGLLIAVCLLLDHVALAQYKKPQIISPPPTAIFKHANCKVNFKDTNVVFTMGNETHVECRTWCSSKNIQTTIKHICTAATGMWTPPIQNCAQLPTVGVSDTANEADTSKNKIGDDKVGLFYGECNPDIKYANYFCYEEDGKHMICDQWCSDPQDRTNHKCNKKNGVWVPPHRNCPKPTCKIHMENIHTRCLSAKPKQPKICDTWCGNDTIAVTHTCDINTGIWDPPVTECQQPQSDMPEMRSAVIENKGDLDLCKVNFNFQTNGNCRDNAETNKRVCDIFCGKNEANIAEYLCDMDTGGWTLPIPDCSSMGIPLEESEEVVNLERNEGCDIEWGYNTNGLCEDDFKKRTRKCNIYCGTDEKDSTSHECNMDTGEWKPQLRKCPRIACDANLIYTDIECKQTAPGDVYRRCETWCDDKRDEATAHTCHLITGVWLPELKNCSPPKMTGFRSAATGYTADDEYDEDEEEEEEEDVDLCSPKLNQGFGPAGFCKEDVETGNIVCAIYCDDNIKNITSYACIADKEVGVGVWTPPFPVCPLLKCSPNLQDTSVKCEEVGPVDPVKRCSTWCNKDETDIVEHQCNMADGTWIPPLLSCAERYAAIAASTEIDNNRIIYDPSVMKENIE